MDSPGCTRHHQDNMTCLGAGISIINHFVSKKNTLLAGRYILTEVILLDGESQAWTPPVTYPILQIMRALSRGWWNRINMFLWEIKHDAKLLSETILARKCCLDDVWIGKKQTYLSWLFVLRYFFITFEKSRDFRPSLKSPLNKWSNINRLFIYNPPKFKKKMDHFFGIVPKTNTKTYKHRFSHKNHAVFFSPRKNHECVSISVSLQNLGSQETHQEFASVSFVQDEHRKVLSPAFCPSSES